MPDLQIRPLVPSDIAALVQIQCGSPEAAQWSAPQYERGLAGAESHAGLVAENGGEVVGFVVYRATAPGETEILNLAVEPRSRRQGIAIALVEALRRGVAGDIFLEVRAANVPAQALYHRAGFAVVGRRKDYYAAPLDDALIMRSDAGSRRPPGS